MQQNVSDFLNSVCSHIRSRKWQVAIRSEISGHIADKVSELCKNGMSEADATAAAIKDMGNPHHIGEHLAKLHKPETAYAVCGLAVFMLLFPFSVLMAGGNVFDFVDPTSMLTVLVGTVVLVLVGGVKALNAEIFLQRFSKLVLPVGGVWSIFGLILLMRRVNDPASLGPAFSVIMLSLFYAFMLSVIAKALEPYTASARIRNADIIGEIQGLC